MGYIVKQDGIPVTYLKLCGSSIAHGSRLGEPYYDSPILFETRIQADLFAAFLAVRCPWCSPYSVHETFKVVPVPKEV